MAVDEVARRQVGPADCRGTRARCRPAPTPTSWAAGRWARAPAPGRARPSAGASSAAATAGSLSWSVSASLRKRDDQSLATVGRRVDDDAAPVDDRRRRDAPVGPRRRRRRARTGAASATRRRPRWTATPRPVIRSCHWSSVSAPHSASVPPTTMTWCRAGCSDSPSRSVVAACVMRVILPRSAVGS